MITFEVLPSHRLVKTQASGYVTYAEMARYLQQLLQSDGYDLRFDALITIADVSSSAAHERDKTVTLINRFAERCGNAKWAFVVGHGLARGIVEITLEGIDLGAVQVQLFSEESEALNWLLGKAA